MRFTLPFQSVATGAVAGTYRTVAAIIAADTAGHRCRLRKLTVTPSAGTPADANVQVKVNRVSDVSAGSAGTPASSVSAANMAKKDPGSIDCLMTGGIDYASLEPSTYDNQAMWQGSFNIRAGMVQYWDEEDAPRITRDMLMGVLATPTAAAAVTLTGSLEFELY